MSAYRTAVPKPDATPARTRGHAWTRLCRKLAVKLATVVQPDRWGICQICYRRRRRWNLAIIPVPSLMRVCSPGLCRREHRQVPYRSGRMGACMREALRLKWS